MSEAGAGTHPIAKLTAALLSLALAQACGADPLVTNSDFTGRSADNPRLAAAWVLPPQSPWTMTDADGHSGKDSVRFSSPARVQAEPVTQAISLPADTALVLSCAMKPDGALTPVVRLRRAGPEATELVRIVGDGPPGIWRQYFADFTSGAGGDVVVELWPDIMQLHRPEQPRSAGTVGFDDVHVVLPADAGALRAEQSEPVAFDNLARGKPYTMHPTPGYPLCSDPDDRIRLTDGQYTVGYFWTQKTTVGWVRVDRIVITLDLQDHYPIRGLSFNKAAGTAGVRWPRAIEVLVSVDGRAYHSVGDLVELSGRRRTPPRDYAVHRFYTDELTAHGRYVKLLITPQANCTFVDEIEVYRGEDQWLDTPLPGEAVNYPPEYFEADPLVAAIKRRMGADLETVRAEVGREQLPAPVGDDLAGQMRDLDAAIRALPAPEVLEAFDGPLPYHAVHARVYGVRGAAWAAQGRPPAVAWGGNPWDYLAPTQLPVPHPPAEVAVAAMRGETRAAVLNLTNCTDQPQAVRLSFDGLPGGPAPDYVVAHEVAWTDAQGGVLVAAALPEVAPRDGSYELSLPAGMTRQAWFSFTPPPDMAGGVHHGELVITGATPEPVRVPVSLRVFDLDFPAQPRLNVGGWSYTDGYMYGVTPGNRAALIAHLQRRHVNSPWATSAVLPFGEFDAQGGLAVEPDTTRFDRWVAAWPDAARYMVFCRVGDSLAGSRMTEPLFAAKVAAWIRFWVAHARSMDIPPERLFLLLVDEPGTVEQDNIIIAWSRAIKAAEPEVVIWDDGTRPEDRHTPELIAAVDYLCPHRPAIMVGEGLARADFYHQQSAAGKGLDLYSCWGPSRTFDPYAYHRLQAWHAFALGGGGSFFWAFGDTGGGHSWNEYASKSASFTPLFLGPDSVTAGKHMEAIRESVGDFEYLALLRDAVADLAQRQPDHPLLARARALLDGAAERVLTAPGAVSEGGLAGMQWNAPRDRTVADEVRIEVAQMLESLGGLPAAE